MYQDLQKRIRQIMEMEGISPSRFADKIQVNRSRLSHIFSGRNNPSLEIVYSIMKAFPDINPAWLLSGIEPVKLSGTESTLPVLNTKNSVNSVEEPGKAEEETPVVYHRKKKINTNKEAGEADYSLNKNFDNEKSPVKIRQIILLYNDGSYEVVNPAGI